MKNVIYILCCLMIGTSGIAQITNYNFGFETGTVLGAWNYFENGTDTAGVKFVANPFPSGINTSATVAKFTASRLGNQWSGCESLYGTLGKWKFNPTSPTTVNVDVYKSTLTPVYIKFTSTNNAGQGTVFLTSATPSAINQWVTLTFSVDFATLGGVDNADNNAGTNQIVFHLDAGSTRNTDQVVYFDNIKFSATKLADPIVPPVAIAAPLVRAPIPPNRNATDVVNIYSGKYAQLSGTRIGKNWGEATIASDIVVQGDTTKQLLRFNYQGIVLAAPINVVGFQKLHIDFFKTDQAQIKLSIIHQGGGDITKLLDITNTGWNSFDIPLTDFVGLNLSTIHQLKLEGAPKQGITTVFFDNVYFHKGTPLSVENFNALHINMYPNPVKNTLTIDAPSDIKHILVFNILGQEVISVAPNSASTTLQTHFLEKGTYIIKITIDGKQATSKFEKE